MSVFHLAAKPCNGRRGSLRSPGSDDALGDTTAQDNGIQFSVSADGVRAVRTCYHWFSPHKLCHVRHIPYLPGTVLPAVGQSSASADDRMPWRHRSHRQADLIGVYHTESFGRDSCGQNSGNDICSVLCNSRFLEPYGVPAKRPDHATAHFTIGNG